MHEFKKAGARKASKEPAIRFICISDAADDANHPGFWMKLCEWNRYRHETYKNRRHDELPFIINPTEQPEAHDGHPAEPVKDEPKGPTGIKAHFEIVSTGKHTQRMKGGGVKEVTCSWYRCIQPGCRRRKDDLIREVGPGTGQLFRELKRCNNELWRKLRIESAHSRLRVGADGKEVQLMSFKEALPHHVRFVKWCVFDWQPFSRSRSKAFRAFVSGLNPAAGLPHRETSIKILRVARTLTDQKLEAAITALRGKVGEPFAGATSDIWSTPSCRASFFCMRLNLILEPDMVFTASSTGAGSTGTRPAQLIEAAPMISFREFQESKHSGAVIAAVKRNALEKFKMTTRSISLMTEDGASNNKSSAKLLGAPFKVCAPHDLQRSVLFAAGMAGARSENPELKEFIGRASKMAAAPHRSTKTSGLLQKSQVAGGTAKSRVLTTETANVTRWTGLFRMAHKVCAPACIGAATSAPPSPHDTALTDAHPPPSALQNRVLEKNLSVALTGSETGLTAEPPADPVSSDPEDSDADEPPGQAYQAAARRDDVDDDEATFAANQAAGKEYPLAHRPLDQRGFRDNALLESVLTHAHEICLILQKDQGVGLTLAWQLLRVLHSAATAPKLQVVSGQSKAGIWSDMHHANLPEMLRKFRTILATQLEQRFHVTTTPDKYTLLALAFDPSVDTTANEGIFSTASAAQELMEGEHRRALMRCQQRTAPARAPAAPPATPAMPPATPRAPMQAAPATPALATGGRAAGKRPVGPASVLSLMQPSKAAAVPVAAADDKKTIDDEIAKFKAICAGVVAEGPASRFYQKNMFDHKSFWFEHRAELPLHYKSFLSEVGSQKSSSANVETVFSGVGGMVAKASSLGSDLVVDYTICHHNWQYDFLLPSEAEIVSTYQTLYGGEAHPSDGEASDDEDGEEDGEDSDDDGEAEDAMAADA